MVLHGDSFSDAYGHARELQQAQAELIHPFDDLNVIAGQGTIATELLRQHQGRLEGVRRHRRRRADRGRGELHQGRAAGDRKVIGVQITI